LQFLNHARGSLYELQTQIKLVARFSYLAGDTADKIGLQAAEVGKVLNGLIRNFRKISTLGSETRA
jgi:four helix bundle protein